MMYCQSCVWQTRETENPTMLTGYCVRGVTCSRCGRLDDCAMVKLPEKNAPALASIPAAASCLDARCSWQSLGITMATALQDAQTHARINGHRVRISATI